jgi:hypothetical protein
VDIPESLLKSAGEYSIKVVDPTIEEDVSNTKTFTVRTSIFLPLITTDGK